MRKISLLLALILVSALIWPMAASAAPKKLQNRVLIANAGEIKVIKQKPYLYVRDAASGMYMIYDTSGNKLTDRLISPAYLNYGIFTDTKTVTVALEQQGEPATDGDAAPGTAEVSKKALVCTKNGYVSGYEYDAIKALSTEWALGLVATRATSEDYDYKYSSSTYYYITRCDVFYIGEAETKLVAALGKEQFSGAAAHGNYISVSRPDKSIALYDRDFNPTGLSVSKLSSSPFAVVDYALIDSITGEVIVDGCSSFEEAITDRGLLFRINRKDEANNVLRGVCTGDGTWLMQPYKCTISSVSADYAVIKDNGLFGLFSFKHGIEVVPCAYEKLLTSKQSLDVYSSYGYACGIKDGQRHYYDMENGELVYVASALSPTEHYMGATVYQRLSRGKYRFTSANGSAVEVPDIIFYSGRGDGGLLMCRSYTNRMYGVITVNGDIAYDYTCRYKPTITDDGKIIVHKFNGLYDLVEVIYPD